MTRKPPPDRIPKAGEGRRGESGYLGYLLRQAAAAHRAQLDHALSDVGITPPQFLVLTMLGAYAGASNADLARLTFLTPQTVSLIVSNLIRAEAVTRRPDAIHGRIVHLHLSAKGRTMLARCRKAVRFTERALSAGLSQPNERIVRRWLVATAAHGKREEA
jgi:DNA-binding MarR family transcriptional regulator